MLTDPSTVLLNLAELSHAKIILAEPSSAGPNPAKCGRDQQNKTQLSLFHIYAESS